VEKVFCEEILEVIMGFWKNIFKAKNGKKLI